MKPTSTLPARSKESAHAIASRLGTPYIIEGQASDGLWWSGFVNSSRTARTYVALDEPRNLWLIVEENL